MDRLVSKLQPVLGFARAKKGFELGLLFGGLAEHGREPNRLPASACFGFIACVVSFMSIVTN
jgi:hypothetical protein